METISVQCPVLNESFWIKAFVENVKKFAHEIVFLDMGSTDGTIEIIKKLKEKEPKIKLFQWTELDKYNINKIQYEPYVWQEGRARNFMINTTMCEWIMPIAPDEMYGDDFIDLTKELHFVKWDICRLQNLTFWKDKNHIRVGSLWPPFNIFNLRNKWHFKWFRNYRGLYPSRRIALIRNTPTIRFENTGNHSNISWKNHNPRINKFIPGLVYDPINLGFYHYHFLGPVKVNENRGDERYSKKVKLMPFTGEHPDEIKLLDFESIQTND